MKRTMKSEKVISTCCEQPTSSAGQNGPSITVGSDIELKVAAIEMRLEKLLVELSFGKQPVFLIVSDQPERTSEIGVEFLKRHPIEPASECGCFEKKQPIVFAESPLGSGEGKLYNSILDALEVKYSRHHPPDQKIDAILKFFGMLNVQMLIINNFDRALSGPAMSKAAMMNTLKMLCNRWKIPVVLMGNRKILNAPDSDFWIISEYL